MEEKFEDYIYKIKDELISRGACFVGFSDVSDVPNNYGFKGAITIAYKLLDSVVGQITTENGPTYQYFHHYRTVNFALDQMALWTATMIERTGHKCLMIPSSQSSVEDPYSGAFPHKTAAVLSGNGFIGKNVQSEKNFLVRILPLFIKKPIIRFIYSQIGEILFTSTISNMGIVKLPKAASDNIKEYQAILGTTKLNRINLAVISIEDVICLSVTTKLKDNALVKDFFNRLSDFNLHLVVESNI